MYMFIRILCIWQSYVLLYLFVFFLFINVPLNDVLEHSYITHLILYK